MLEESLKVSIDYGNDKDELKIDIYTNELLILAQTMTGMKKNCIKECVFDPDKGCYKLITDFQDAMISIVSLVSRLPDGSVVLMKKEILLSINSIKN